MDKYVDNLWITRDNFYGVESVDNYSHFFHKLSTSETCIISDFDIVFHIIHTTTITTTNNIYFKYINNSRENFRFTYFFETTSMVGVR